MVLRYRRRRRRCLVSLSSSLILGLFQEIGQLIQSGEFFHRQAAVVVVAYRD